MLGLMRLENPIQHYAWGSKTALARLQGRQAATEPEAEVWIGAHPQAPSVVTVAGRRVTLDRLLADRPDEMLGPAVERFGAELPFLLKVLAVAEPLSIQAHPSLEQAAEGFAREQAAGIAPDAPNRNYRDRNHKPELAVALEPYWMMSGFRPYAELVHHLEVVGVPELRAANDGLRRQPTGRALAALMATVLQLSDRERADLVSRTEEHAASQLRREDRGSNPEDTGSPSSALTEAETASRWVQRLAASYPGDAGVLSPYLLNVLHLAPGEGTFTGAGTLHAALSGTAVELQANSDNVLRGGLTVKHVDVPELLRVARFVPQEAAVLNPAADANGERRYPTPAAEFALSSVALDTLHGAPFVGTTAGPEILLFLYGDAAVTGSDGRTVGCRPGEALFVPAAVKGYRVNGKATMFRARVPLPSDPEPSP
ncbi:MAG: mannose-6-phosphate isomerase, class I [Spirochaetaceae bacterium]|nr:mannose-6-phosphate isomerase, class I [Spirochaetaceae bacterium]